MCCESVGVGSACGVVRPAPVITATRCYTFRRVYSLIDIGAYKAQSNAISVAGGSVGHPARYSAVIVYAKTNSHLSILFSDPDDGPVGSVELPLE